MKQILRGLFIATALSFFCVVSHAKVLSVSIKTKDGVVLKARYNPPQPGKPLVIMLHGLASVKEEYLPLETSLIQKGWGTLAYDARGHGESSLTKDEKGGPNGYQYFGRPGPGSQWERMIDDVGAVIRYARSEKKLSETPIYLCGASLGANVALNYASLTRSVRAVVLLSPGLSYAEIQAEPALAQAGKLPILMVASPGDSYAHMSCLTLKKLNPAITFWDDVKAGHGVQMFDAALLGRIVSWMAGH